MSSSSFSDVVNKLRGEDVYWVESAKMDFALGISDLMKIREMSRSDLAKVIGKSPAYISKVLRGDTNFTIESMVKLARAVQGTLHLKVCDQEHSARFFSWTSSKVASDSSNTASIAWLKNPGERAGGLEAIKLSSIRPIYEKELAAA